jgi:ubiquinone/menaquinone biosynthesis C-methylase UbiE
MKQLIQNLYNATLRGRRLRKLTSILSPVMDSNSLVLDLGCGNGDLAVAIKQNVPNLNITGIDVLMRGDQTVVPVHAYDGKTIPFPDNAFDYVMLVTVLHHTDDYIPVLQEALRVSQKGIILVDHQYGNWFEWMILAIIDAPGNIPFGVYTPFNFKKREQWQAMFKQLNLDEVRYDDKLYLFGKPLDFILGRRMHFLSVLNKKA